VSQIRLYLDEDALQDALVLALQSSGVDVITVANDSGEFAGVGL
jgi:hypothetical protein